jgi:hypothetical protein
MLSRFLTDVLWRCAYLISFEAELLRLQMTRVADNHIQQDYPTVLRPHPVDFVANEDTLTMIAQDC